MAAAVCIVTTFSEKLWEQYAEDCLQSWAVHFPPDYKVLVCCEHPIDLVRRSQFPLAWHWANLRLWSPYHRFMETHTTQNIPDWRRDVRRFAHKIFALGFADHTVEFSHLIWLDADVFCFEDIPADFFPSLFQEKDLFYLGRKGYTHSECGCWGIVRQEEAHAPFIWELQQLYETGRVCQLPYQHDSWVFDWLRKQWERQGRLHATDISKAQRGHVWLTSPLADYLDHWKGDRWKTRKSWKSDESALLAQGARPRLQHPYWRHLPNRERGKQ